MRTRLDVTGLADMYSQFWLLAAIAGFVQLKLSLCDHNNPSNAGNGEEEKRQIHVVTDGWRRCKNENLKTSYFVSKNMTWNKYILISYTLAWLLFSLPITKLFVIFFSSFLVRMCRPLLESIFNGFFCKRKGTQVL